MVGFIEKPKRYIVEIEFKSINKEIIEHYRVGEYKEDSITYG